MHSSNNGNDIKTNNLSHFADNSSSDYHNVIFFFNLKYSLKIKFLDIIS